MRGVFGAPGTTLLSALRRRAGERGRTMPRCVGPRGGKASASSAVILCLLQRCPVLRQVMLLETFDETTRNGKPGVKYSLQTFPFDNVTSPRTSRFARLQDVGDKGDTVEKTNATPAIWIRWR